VESNKDEVKSKDILTQKAGEKGSLKDSVDDKSSESGEQGTKPETFINDEGKKVIVFQDPLYSREKRSVVNYTIFKGKWEFENMEDIDDTEPEKCAVKFSPEGERASFTIVFKSIKDRVEFMDSIYSNKEMKQVGTGMSLETMANSKVLKTTGGLIGLSLAGVAGYGLYKLFGKGKGDSD
jgi:hypothetical protein